MPRLEHPASGRLPHPYITAGYGTQYGDTIYCWDNHHMAMRFALGGQPEYLKSNVDNFLAHQGEDGYVPNVISQANGPLAIAPSFHALPFLTQAVLLYVTRTGDTAWLEQTFPKLENYLRYFETELSAPFGLFRWSMPWMSGLDNDAAKTAIRRRAAPRCCGGARMAHQGG